VSANRLAAKRLSANRRVGERPAAKRRVGEPPRRRIAKRQNAKYDLIQERAVEEMPNQDGRRSRRIKLSMVSNAADKSRRVKTSDF